MPVAKFQMTDGRVARFEVPDGTTPEQAQALIQGHIDNIPSEKPQDETPRYASGDPSPPPIINTGVAETLATVVSSMAAEPIAGVAGIAQSLNPFADGGAGAEAVSATRNALTYEPSTTEGRANLVSLSKTLAPLAEIVEKVEKTSGDIGFDLAGPMGGALGEALPTAVAELLGLTTAKLAAKSGAKVNRIANAVPDDAAQSLLDAGKKFDVPILTTDAVPPKGYLGRFGQSLSEKLGPLGSGSARASQQKARESAVIGFAENMDIDLDSPFAGEMIKSLNAKSAKELERAGAIRGRAVKSLDAFGEVPLTRTKAAIAEQIARQQRLGAKGDNALIKSLQDTADALEGGDFSMVKDIRTEVISDLKAISRGEDTRSAASVQSVKSAIDKDMMNFAGANDRGAAADWIRSNRAFAEAYTRTKDTELRRILKQGDATPEKVIPLLRGGKPSELQRLKRSLGPKGQNAARKAIIQDALKESKFFEVDSNPNPDAFATALNKPNRQQAFKVFFEGAEKAEIDGLTRLLNATRRAQQGSAVIKTGEQMIPAAVGGAAGVGLYVDAMTAIPAVTVASALAKSYESAKFRNLLLKLSNTPKGSKAETGLLEMASTFAVAGLQAAKTAQQEPEE